jgi:hypothetical protein
MTSSGEPCLHLSGLGAARADLPTIAALRKSLPAWAPSDTPGHFLKHADEQTVLAVAALDQAIQSSGHAVNEYCEWAIVAAPRFIGRMAGGATLNRYSRGGGPAISPHLIPQHSLHSISGALSILLATRHPNFGIGGTSNSLVEGLLTAIAFPGSQPKGIWLIATAWDPEPQLDESGNCCNAPVCHAVALALQSAAQHGSCGRLRLVADREGVESSRDYKWSVDAAGLCRRVTALMPGAPATRFAWDLPFGGTVILEATKTFEATKVGANLRAAA